MDEYYCPNCDAILNDQLGFDPDNGSWTCTSCGKLLMDEDVYEGDTYEGVAWYCDECDALLNRQSGFSDSCGTWTCTECGHTNGITEDDIYDSKEDYQYYKTTSTTSEDDEEDNDDDVYYCPVCDETLNEQWCFDEYAEEWTCTCCSTKLRYNDIEDEYEIMNKVETKYSSYSTDNSKSDSKNRSHTNKVNRSKEPKKKDRSWIAIIICFVIALGIPFGMMLKFEVEEKIAVSEGKINAGFYKDLIGEDYKTVEAHFDSAGFTDIELIDLNDSGILFWKDGKVENISIAGNNTFDSTDWFNPDSKVVISYH